MRVGWWNEQLNCPFKITKLPFWTAPLSSLQKAALPRQNNWMPWSLQNGLKADHKFQFTSSKKGKRKLLKVKLQNSMGLFYRTQGAPRGLFWILRDTQWAVEELWCKEAGSWPNQQSTPFLHEDLECHPGFSYGLLELHIMHYLICIMHQQALNIKLWMHAKIPRVVYAEKWHFAVQIICPLFMKLSNMGFVWFCTSPPSYRHACTINSMYFIHLNLWTTASCCFTCSTSQACVCYWAPAPLPDK